MIQEILCLATAALLPAAQPTPSEKEAKAPTAAKSWKQRAAIPAHRGSISAMQLSPDGRWLATGGGEGLVRLWDVRTGKLHSPLQRHPQPIAALTFTPDSKRVLSLSSEGGMQTWDLAARRVSASSRLSLRTPVAWGSFSRDGSLLAVTVAQDFMTGQQNRGIHLWDVATGKPRRSLAGHELGTSNVMPSPDGKLLVSLGSVYRKDAPPGVSFSDLMEGEVKLWTVADGKSTLLPGNIGTMAFAPDGKTLATATYSKALRGYQVELWDASGKKLRTFEGHGGTIYCLAFSGDGASLAVGNAEKLIHVWDVAGGKPAASLRGHTTFILKVDLSPDGRLLASADSDGVVRLWEATD